LLKNKVWLNKSLTTFFFICKWWKHVFLYFQNENPPLQHPPASSSPTHPIPTHTNRISLGRTHASPTKIVPQRRDFLSHKICPKTDSIFSWERDLISKSVWLHQNSSVKLWQLIYGESATTIISGKFKKFPSYLEVSQYRSKKRFEFWQRIGINLLGTWCRINPSGRISYHSWCRDGPWPDPSLLLTRSIWEADPQLTWVLFDPTQRDFFDSKGKNWKIWHF